MFRRIWLAVMAFFATGFLGVNAHIAGVLGSESGNQDRRPKHWKDEIQYLDEDRTMFTQLLTRLETVKITDPEFKLFEREYPQRWVRVAEPIDTSEPAIDVDDATFFRAGDVIMNTESGERMLFVSAAGNTITVTRGVLGTTGTAASDNSWLLLLFERKSEYSVSGTPITTDYQTVTNFAQIFERTYGVSETRKRTKMRGPSDLNEERKIALTMFKRDLEHMILWGKKRLENTAGTTYWYSGGVDEFITSNRASVDGGLGFGDIGWIVNQSTRYGGSKKIWFCGRDARVQLDSLGLEYMRIKPEDNILGMAVDGVRTSFGEFMMVTHHGLENGLADRIYIIDPEHIALAVLEAMHHRSHLEENDRHGEKHGFIGQMGLWLSQEEAHMVVTGVTNSII